MSHRKARCRNEIYSLFDIPDDYGIGCATAKIALKGKDKYEDKDFENAYAQVEPLSEQKEEVIRRFNAVERIIGELGLSCAYDMPGFWCNKKKDYKVIPTKYHQGYQQALKDVEKEVRMQFGFSERDNIVMPPPFES